MKHFSVSAPGSTRHAGASELASDLVEDGNMTQKGYKTFRRRRSMAQASRSDLSRAPVKAVQPVHSEPDSDPAAPMNGPMQLRQEVRVAPEENQDQSQLSASDQIESPPTVKAQLKRRSRAETAAICRKSAVAQPAQRDATGEAEVLPPLLLQPDVQLAPQPDLPARFDPWDHLPEVPFDFEGQHQTSQPLVSAFRTTPTARAFDLLRTRLLHSLKAHGWKRVAITSPTAGGGTTFCAVNLALSLARVPNSRTLLLDMNLRSPGVAAALGLAPKGNMADFLAGERAPRAHLQRLSPSLAVGCNAVADPDASEILHDRRCKAVLNDTIKMTGADSVIFDLPPVLEHDDVAAFLPQVDGVLLVSDGEETTAAQLAASERMLAGQAPLLGVVLNRAPKIDA